MSKVHAKTGKYNINKKYQSLSMGRHLGLDVCISRGNGVEGKITIIK